MRMIFSSMLTSTLILSATALHAGTVTLQSLLGGGIITEGEVTFSLFNFSDRFATETKLDGDRAVAASQIHISTETSGSTVSLTASVEPAILIEGVDPSSTFEHLFEFTFDFTASVNNPSGNSFVNVALSSEDLFATGGESISEVVFDGFGSASQLVSNLEIFEDSGTDIQKSDEKALAKVTDIAMEGFIFGSTDEATSRAGLETFTLTYTLEKAPPVIDVVPLPAGLPLVLAAFGSFVWLRRKQQVTA